MSYYTKAHAELCKASAGKPFRPANGTEGEMFFDGYCRNCARDKAMSEGKAVEDCDDDEKCDLIALSMAFDETDPRYPKAWVYGKDGQPTCTAFIPAGDPIPQPRCQNTIDMFGDAP